MRRLSLILAGVLCAPALAMAITAGQVDDFQDATLQGWTSGVSNPNGPTNENGQGPAGAGDRALVATSDGSSGAGGKLVIFNEVQWTGDYLAAGVNALRMDLRNLGEADLTIRAVLRGNGGAFATTQGAELDADAAGFTSAVLSLVPEDLTFVGVGSPDVMATLGNVTELRLLHSTAPAERGTQVSAELAVDNVTALACASGLAAKADSPADFLLLPAFEVDTTAAEGLTTFFAVNNQTEMPRTVLVRYFDRAGNLQRTDELFFAPHQTRTTNVRGVQDLMVDADGVARGSVQVHACAAAGDAETATLTGDYIFLDDEGNFATGDQLLRREDVCAKLQVRLLNFGSGVRLRLYASDPQGAIDPTATFTVHNEAGAMLDSGPIMLTDAVTVVDSTELTAIRFGTLDIELVAGGGALSVEYSAFGRFSVAMNATCVEP